MSSPAYLAVASMMRMFAWCGTSKSISSAVIPACWSATSHASAMERTAFLKTSRPSMCTRWRAVSSTSWRDGLDRAAGRTVEQAGEVPVRAQVAREDATARAVRALQDGGAGSVAEEHAGGAVLPVQDRAHLLGGDHERDLAPPARQVALGHAQAVDEARAGGHHVEREGVPASQLGLHVARRGRHPPVGRRGADDDRVHLARVDPGALHGRFRSAGAEVGVCMPAGARRRSRMPVRVRIHSSEVSIRFARSSFVTTLSGRYRPVARISTIGSGLLMIPPWCCRSP
jgi:hypothetical protein